MMKRLLFLIIVSILGCYFLTGLATRSLAATHTPDPNYKCSPSDCDRQSCDSSSCNYSCSLYWDNATGDYYCGWRCTAYCPAGSYTSCPPGTSCNRSTVTCATCGNTGAVVDCYTPVTTVTPPPLTITPPPSCGPWYCDVGTSTCNGGKNWQLASKCSNGSYKTTCDPNQCQIASTTITITPTITVTPPVNVCQYQTQCQNFTAKNNTTGQIVSGQQMPTTPNVLSVNQGDTVTFSGNAGQTNNGQFILNPTGSSCSSNIWDMYSNFKLYQDPLGTNSLVAQCASAVDQSEKNAFTSFYCKGNMATYAAYNNNAGNANNPYGATWEPIRNAHLYFPNGVSAIGTCDKDGYAHWCDSCPTLTNGGICNNVCQTTTVPSHSQLNLAECSITASGLTEQPRYLTRDAKATYTFTQAGTTYRITDTMHGQYGYGGTETGNKPCAIDIAVKPGASTPCTDLGGVATSKPSEIVYQGKFYVFVKGSDNAVYYKTSSDGATYSPSNWINIGGIGFSDPATGVGADGRLYLQIQGTGGSNYYISTNGLSWSNWAVGNSPYPVSTTSTVSFNSNSYTASITGWSSVQVCVGATTITPVPPTTYSITGRVFNDLNGNKIFDPGEEYSGGVSITTTSPAATVTYGASGTYTISGITQGQYTITYNGPPPGYLLSFPVPSSFIVRVGIGCSVLPTGGGTCTAGSIQNLNFAITKSLPWFKAYGGDMRFDNSMSFNIPDATTSPSACENLALSPYNNASHLTTTGIIYGGNGDLTFQIGSSSKLLSSATKWVAGGNGPNYPESYGPPGRLHLSYDSIYSLAKAQGVTLQSLPCNMSGCSLPSGLDGSVIYISNGSLTLNAIQNNTFKHNTNYIFLVNGSITINTPINLPVANNTTVTFIAENNITIGSGVGTAPACPPTDSTNNVDGTFVAGSNFTIDKRPGTCATGVSDKMLNMEGSIIVNANRTGGRFINNRDLCSADTTIPTFTIRKRLDFIINAPTFLMNQNVSFKEVAP